MPAAGPWLTTGMTTVGFNNITSWHLASLARAAGRFIAARFR
ncbi:MAG: hypothetical protein QOE61_1562 [Micromonosporaceae bacterium]|jgi:hypothetical protein|nr:hypothetical protein [Micromonosporaceae bacterium]